MNNTGVSNPLGTRILSMVLHKFLFLCSYGFVKYATVDEAKAVFDSPNDIVLDGRSLYIDYASPQGNSVIKLILVYLLNYLYFRGLCLACRQWCIGLLILLLNYNIYVIFFSIS